MTLHLKTQYIGLIYSVILSVL
jgi:hypothetical protein